MFLFGPPNVEKMKARKDVKGLIKATGYSKDYGKIRQSAILALIEIGRPAVDPLIAALESKNDDMRKASTEALCKIGAPAVEPLIVALKGKSSAMRKAAAEILGNIGNDHAVEPLVDTLRDAEPNVRATAAEALGRLGSVRATQPLISTLKDKDSDVRKVAAKALKSMGASAVEQVILALGDSDKEMRLAAARALGEIGDPCAVEHLLAALKDKESNVRAEAVGSLGKLGDTRAVAPLITALNDTDDDVSTGAAEALGQLGDPRAVGPLIDAFKKWAKKGFIHGIEKAARALDRFGYAIVAPLLPMCEERNLLYATALTGTLVSLEAAARGSRDEALQMLAKTGAVFDVIKEKEQKIQQKAQRIIGDLVAQHLIKEQSRQPQQLSEESHFQRYSGSGLCDVCNRNIESGEAYLVPVDVFYSSRKYRNWLANGPMKSMIELTGGVEKYIAQARTMDPTSHSAVCSNCIHMFERPGESSGTSESKTMADVLGYGKHVVGVTPLRSIVVDTTVSAERANARCPAYRDKKCVNPRTHQDTGPCSWNPEQWTTCSAAQLHSMWK